MNYKVPFIKPSFPSAEELADDYSQIVASNWFTNFGPFERKFAEELSHYIGEGYFAVTFSSATAGLLASTLALLGRGDGTQYIIIPSFTFVAGADVIEWCGYKPLLVDIESAGFQMDIDETRAALKKHKDTIAGIMFCNAFGVGANNIKDWETLAAETQKPLIIDSAAGFGSLYNQNCKVGSAGICEVFSFHATKAFAIGEGGAVITRNEELAKTLMQTENFGFEEKNAVRLGFNGKLQEINAAIGLQQLKRFDERLEARRRNFRRYNTELNTAKYSLQQNAEKAALCFAAVIVKEVGKRDEQLKKLQQAGVDAKTYYNPPIHRQDYFKNSKTHGQLKVTENICASVLSLPSYDSMNKEDIDLIIGTLNG